MADKHKGYMYCEVKTRNAWEQVLGGDAHKFV